jgi:hypothetical protein
MQIGTKIGLVRAENLPSVGADNLASDVAGIGVDMHIFSLASTLSLCIYDRSTVYAQLGKNPGTLI